MKKYNRGNLNEVANTYKKMILSEETSTTQREDFYDPYYGFGRGPLTLPTKPKPKPVLPDDLEDLPFDLAPEFPDRPAIYRAPGTKIPMRLPALKPGIGAIGRGLLGRVLWPYELGTMIGSAAGTYIDDVFIDPMYRPAKPTPDQLRPVPSILPSPELLYPSPTTATGFRTPARPSGGSGSGGGGSGGGMGGM